MLLHPKTINLISIALFVPVTNHAWLYNITVIFYQYGMRQSRNDFFVGATGWNAFNTDEGKSAHIWPYTSWQFNWSQKNSSTRANWRSHRDDISLQYTRQAWCMHTMSYYVSFEVCSLWAMFRGCRISIKQSNKSRSAQTLLISTSAKISSQGINSSQQATLYSSKVGLLILHFQSPRRYWL